MSSRVSRSGQSQYSNTPLLHYSARKRRAFALYEVLLGVSIFAVGVLTLGRAVENCLNASTLSAEEGRIRGILFNRMAEVQTAPGFPEVSKQIKIDTGYGKVTLTQKSAPANLTEPDGNKLTGIFLVTLTAEWQHGGTGGGTEHHVERSSNVMAQWIRDSAGGNTTQTESIEFYVYRPG